jgi:hypothetical protein
MKYLCVVWLRCGSSPGKDLLLLAVPISPSLALTSYIHRHGIYRIVFSGVLSSSRPSL